MDPLNHFGELQNTSRDQQRRGLRGTTEDERALLRHVTHFGSEGYPVKKLGRRWSWGPWRTVDGPPTVFRTKREAVAHLESFLSIVRDAEAGRI